MLLDGVPEQARRELLAVIRRNGHRVDVPDRLGGPANWSGVCRKCGKAVGVRFDVPCGWLVVGTGAGAACHVAGA